MLPRFEEEDVVAGVEVCEGVECGIVLAVGFRIELSIFVGVWKEGLKIVEKMSMSTLGQV